MKQNKLLLISLIILTISKLTSAQGEVNFKPGGKPEFRVFSDFNSVFSNGSNVNRFEVTRAYLGYSYNFSKTFSGRMTYDVGNPSAGKFQMTALLKFAYLQYRKNNLSITIGMIPTTIFDLADKKWGYRYIYKSFQDEYGLGASADLGICGEYIINKWFSADAILINGEGYKQMDSDSVLKGGIGLTFLPVKNITIRGYIESMKKRSANQMGYSLLASFENNRFNLNAEFSHQADHNLVNGQNYGGISLFGTLLLKKKFKLFARFDQLKSGKLTGNNQPWNISKDGQLYLAGFEFSPVQGVKISPNFQGWQPAKLGIPFISKFYLNIEFRM
jgi:hypothetical protein